MIEAKGRPLDEFYRAIGISRATMFNWLKRQSPPPSEEKQAKLAEYFSQPAEFVLHGIVKVQESKTARPSHNPGRGAVHHSSSLVASRIPPERRIPTRADCENYVTEVFAGAEASGDPSAWPVLLHRLKKQFPLDEFSEDSGPQKTKKDDP